MPGYQVRQPFVCSTLEPFLLAIFVEPGQVITPTMRKQIHLVLGDAEIFQLLDGLEAREESWRKTAAYLRTGDSGDDFFLIEECSNAEEANAIANDYSTIIAKIRTQLENQPPPTPTPQIQSPPKSGTVPAYAIYIDTLCQGRVAIERDDKNQPVAYATERDAQLEIADVAIDRIRQFISGERDYDDAITVEEYVEAVDLHPDGSITDEYGNTYPNDSW
jgi:hypothetical protein